MSDHGRMHVQHPGGSATPDAWPAHPYPRITSFRSRRSALTEAQQEVWDRLWPELGTQARSGGGQERSDTGFVAAKPADHLDTNAWFGREAPVVLEIGCGTGTSTFGMAMTEPGIDVVAAEVYRRGLAQLLSAIDREGLSNIRLVRGDALDVLEHMFAAGELTGVRVFFPDPWPKSRHHKRRLLQPSTIALIADRLRPGGVLHAATDHAGYAEQIAEAGDAEPLLERVQPGDELPISVQRPTTKYETKASHAGSPVTELLWLRRR
ncbi:tRNA (guanosine(46)-N7)-methyltransferase TrmB [Mycolicibacterium sp. Dal123E01]|uniref:tRNA (guanosine(46)-N7)-methyltransferase TrmB n=1 Tax=Mycolicibacterium sp. Dal123E01 TaxID=3457578 RepID=UPI00403EF44E